jgi:hypothetical protein
MPTPSEQIRALTDANARLRADREQSERDNAGLKATKTLLEQRIRLLEVVVTILLASIASLSVELATRTLGATAQIAFGSATGVFFAVIAASIAILSFIRHA